MLRKRHRLQPVLQLGVLVDHLPDDCEVFQREVSREVRFVQFFIYLKLLHTLFDLDRLIELPLVYMEEWFVEFRYLRELEHRLRNEQLERVLGQAVSKHNVQLLDRLPYHAEMENLPLLEEEVQLSRLDAHLERLVLVELGGEVRFRRKLINYFAMVVQNVEKEYVGRVVQKRS